MATKHRPWIKRLNCPECSERGTMRKILYGYPGSDFDFEKFAVGGCVFQGFGLDPDIACNACGWSGHRNDLDNFYPDRIHL